MQIKDNITNVNYKPRGTNPTWIVIHNTANGTSAAGTAYNNTVYFKNTYREASAHYFVDDGDTVWRCVRDTDTAWHVGEAPSKNGCYNSNAIGIEVCETASGRFTDKEIATLQELVPMLMQKYGIPASRLIRHHDVTGKQCPWYYCDNARWEKLKSRILEGDDMATPADVWGYNWNNTAPGGNMYNAVLGMYSYMRKVGENVDKLNDNTEKLADSIEKLVNTIEEEKEQ